MFFRKQTVTAYEIKEVRVGTSVEKQKTTLLDGVKRVMGKYKYKDPQNINNQYQLNAKSMHYLYLTANDPILPQNTRVEWSINGAEYSGTVLYYTPMVERVHGFWFKVTIRSDNQ